MRQQKKPTNDRKSSVLPEAKMTDSGLYEAQVLGVRVVGAPLPMVLTLLLSKFAKKAYTRPYFVTTVNPEFVMTAQVDPEFRQILNGCDLPLADGKGLRWVDPKLEVVPGRKLVEALVSKRVYKVFYLGAGKGIAKMMADKYRVSNIEYRNDNWDQGSGDIKSEILNPKPETISNDQIIKKINKYKPDLLLVAYGAPWQEKWIARNLERIQAKVVIGVGGTFDYLTGNVRTPPDWLSRAGLEWLWRLVREPWRWRRQLRLVKYLALVLHERFMR